MIPREIDASAIVVTGLSAHHPAIAGAPGFAQQWEQFGPRMHMVPGRVGPAAFGVCLPGDERGMIYVTGVETRDCVADANFVSVTLPAARYAVFEHRGSPATFCQTIAAAEAGIALAGLAQRRGPDVPGMIEYYGADFDPRTGTGTIELWFPVETAERTGDAA